MFCPKCGAAEQSTDSYCKRCGEWLPDTSHLGRRRGRLRARTPEQRNRRMRILEAASALSALGAAVLIAAVMAGRLDKPALAIAMDLCIVTAMFQVVTFLIGYSLQKRQKQGRDEVDKSINLESGKSGGQLNPADTGHLVPPPPSVTESTTALLEPAPNVAGRKEGGRK
jgi:hypothetical protein